MKHNRFFFLFAFLIISNFAFSQTRKIINIPNIPGYQTLKCDFNLHTVFSDGTVWPTVRVEEAWQEGLDAIAISDYIDYRPHSVDIVSNHNRSFEIAQPIANELNIILIRAAEISQTLPPGGFNALFIRNANLLERDDMIDAIQEARDQGAFLIWNQPCREEQETDSVSWEEEYSELLNNGLLNGIEIYNNGEFCPEAFVWANEKTLTFIGNSDRQNPIGMTYDLAASHRPMTLVFSRTRNTEGIKDALLNHRTVVYSDNILMGNADFLEPLFFASLSFGNTPLQLRNGITKNLEIRNNSDIDYDLELVQPGVGFDAPQKIVLKAHRLTPLFLSGNSEQLGNINSLNIYYKVNNAFVNPEENLIVTFTIRNN